jgi:hypothetical protein
MQKSISRTYWLLFGWSLTLIDSRTVSSPLKEISWSIDFRIKAANIKLL